MAMKSQEQQEAMALRAFMAMAATLREAHCDGDFAELDGRLQMCERLRARVPVRLIDGFVEAVFNAVDEIATSRTLREPPHHWWRLERALSLALMRYNHKVAMRLIEMLGDEAEAENVG